MSESAIASIPSADDAHKSTSAKAPSAPARLEGEVETEGLWHRLGAIPSIVYWTIHAGCLVALYTGVGAFEIALCLGLFWARLFGSCSRTVVALRRRARPAPTAGSSALIAPPCAALFRPARRAGLRIR